uniref:Neprosin PEP catalytic domain-containing protein n=1 Tax=Aegilops tauschii TaxID=37682 RepID=M8BFH1_AEGTA
MKEKKSFRVALLLSYLVLVAAGKGARTIQQWENTSQIPTYQQFKKTIMMEDGDIYDCIDVNLQPAFNHPLLKDHTIQVCIFFTTVMRIRNCESVNPISDSRIRDVNPNKPNPYEMEPTSFPIGLNIKSSFPHVVSQAHFSIVECPRGMVPILRNGRRDQISAHFIDQAINKDAQLEEAGMKYFDDLYGVQATINVYEPKVKKDSGDLSQTGIQIDNGPKGHMDSINACYSVSPSFYGDTFARFHVGWSCIDHDCPGFVQVSHNVGLGGRVKPVSVYNGPQYVIHILIFKDPKTHNCWLAYGKDKTPVGYWPSSLFTSLKDKGNFSYTGGHASGPTASSDSPQIGSGHFASEGYGKAAFIKDIQIIDNNNKLVTPNEEKAISGSSDLRKYTIGNYGVDDHGVHMYYGGPGNFV